MFKTESCNPAQKISTARRGGIIIFAAAMLLTAAVLPVYKSFAQADRTPAGHRVGERLTYAVSFERYRNVAYAEMFVASRGLLADKDAVELRARFKTLDFVAAAFYLIDESRTTFASAESGMPLYTVRSQNVGGLPNETIANFIAAPTANLDLLTLLYRIRTSGGSGNFTMQDGGRVYSVAVQTAGSERVQTAPATP